MATQEVERASDYAEDEEDEDDLADSMRQLANARANVLERKAVHIKVLGYRLPLRYRPCFLQLALQADRQRRRAHLAVCRILYRRRDGRNHGVVHIEMHMRIRKSVCRIARVPLNTWHASGLT